MTARPRIVVHLALAGLLHVACDAKESDQPGLPSAAAAPAIPVPTKGGKASPQPGVKAGARDMFVEAKAVLDVAVAENPPTPNDSTSVVLRAIANIMIGRADAALKDLSNPFVGNQHDAPLWRALL